MIFFSLQVCLLLNKLAEIKSFLKFCQQDLEAVKAYAVITFEIVVWVNYSLKFNLY